jgi:adenine deaminase
MLIPSQFAKLAVCHGTVAAVSDPHEIANVLGIKGINFMIENSRSVPFKIFFGAPSCVPATDFETSGYCLPPVSIKELLDRNDIYYLSEMMNFPGVIKDFPEVMEKISMSKKAGKPIDGHAPGLTGNNLLKYFVAGITTDHECSSKKEAIEKIATGMKIIIREGSSAKNFDELCELIDEYPDMVMLCTDDIHPDDLMKGHINNLIIRGLKRKLEIFNLLRAATYNPARHYRLNAGLLQTGDPADFIVVDNPESFRVLGTFIGGNEVYSGKTSLINVEVHSIPNNFNCIEINENDIQVKGETGIKVRVIEAKDGELITGSSVVESGLTGGLIMPDIENDILKIVVVNRYRNEHPATGFIRGFGLKKGAIAGSIAHDSHNVIGVGTNDRDLVSAINKVIQCRGAITVCCNDECHILELPVAGLMSDKDGYEVAEKYALLDQKAKEYGSDMKSPFMTLSFMALLVIPELKLSDRGLFDSNKFCFTDLLMH